MEENKVSANKIMMNYGLILGIISVVIGVVTYVTNNHLSPNILLGILAFIVFIIIVVIGQKTFRKENSGFMSLGQAIKIGVGIALISAIIGVIWQLVLTTVLEPDFAEQALEVQRQTLIESGRNLTDAQIDQSLAISKKMSQPAIALPLQIIAGVFFGFIISLISGLILKKENPYKDA